MLEAFVAITVALFVGVIVLLVCEIIDMIRNGPTHLLSLAPKDPADECPKRAEPQQYPYSILNVECPGPIDAIIPSCGWFKAAVKESDVPASQACPQCARPGVAHKIFRCWAASADDAMMKYRLFVENLVDKGSGLRAAIARLTANLRDVQDNLDGLHADVNVLPVGLKGFEGDTFGSDSGTDL